MAKKKIETVIEDASKAMEAEAESLGVAEVDELDELPEVASAQPAPRTELPPAALAPPQAPVIPAPAVVAAPEPETKASSWIVTKAGYVFGAHGVTPVGLGSVIREHTHDMAAFREARAAGRIDFEDLDGGL